MSNDKMIECRGEIVESFPNAQFKVHLENGLDVLGYVAGRLRRHYIKILPGDQVTIELSPYDLSKGRITFRHKK